MIISLTTSPDDTYTFAPRLSSPIPYTTCGVHVFTWLLASYYWSGDGADPAYLEAITPADVPRYVLNRGLWIEYPITSDTWYPSQCLIIDSLLMEVIPVPDIPTGDFQAVSAKAVKYWTDVVDE